MAELTRPTLGPEILAKSDGPCKGCPRPIKAGESYIVVVDKVGTMHAQCAYGYRRVLEEHAEEGEE